MRQNICVVGTGYVGLVSAICLANFGHFVVTTDIQKEKVESLQRAIFPLYEPGLDNFAKRVIKEGNLRFSLNSDEVIYNSNVIIIAVGTPLNSEGRVDLSAFYRAVEYVSTRAQKGSIIIIKSTVPVGTNAECQEKFSSLSLHFVSNPEFLREGRALQDFMYPNRIVIGLHDESIKESLLQLFYPLSRRVPFIWCKPETAEMTKYASNTFLATKISFINQIAQIAEVIGADINTVSHVMGLDPRIGPDFLKPGPGFGGSCLPKDLAGLIELSENHGVDASFLNEVGKTNERQLSLIYDKIKRHFTAQTEKICILGLAFKAETDDIRESAALYIVDRLIEDRKTIHAHDPKAIENFSRERPKAPIRYFDHVYDAIEGCDILVILTEWDTYRNLDLDRLTELMTHCIIIDTRNIVSSEIYKRSNVTYEGVGRTSMHHTKKDRSNIPL